MKMRVWKVAAAVLAAGVLNGAELPTLPEPCVPDAASFRERPMAERALKELRSRRERLLRQAPISVTFDKRLPSPDGDPRDFTSCGPYWWPDPQRPDGLPYIRRDGEFNPDFKYYDQSKVGSVSSWVTTGALLWKIDRDEAAAAKAVELLRVFFVDDATRMNPHMKYAQGVPGHSKGRTEGIIDTLGLADLVNMLVLLDDASAMTPEVREGLRKWFREYAAWLSSDPMALRDYGKEQNHGLSYHVQLIAYARYCGDEAAARKNLEMMRSLVVKAVDKQGFLPAEVVRTRSWHYSAYALRMVMRAVGAGRAMGVDLLDPATESGRAIRRGVEKMMSYQLDPELKWPYPLLKGKRELGDFGSVVIQYGAYTGSPEAMKLLPQLESKIGYADRLCFAPAEAESTKSAK